MGIVEFCFVADEGGADVGACNVAIGAGDEFHDDGEAIGALAEGGEVGGKFFREHGEDGAAGVNRSAIGAGMNIGGGIFFDDRIDISDADEDADVAVGKLLGPLDLVEVAGFGVVNRRPSEVAEIAAGGGGLGGEGLDFGEDGGREIGLEAVFEHGGAGFAGEIEV